MNGKQMSRKQFLESQGVTYANPYAWSFVNEKEKFVVFGQWEHQLDNKILSETWATDENGRKRGNYKTALKHIDLIEKEGFQLKTFLQRAEDPNPLGSAKIKRFTPSLVPKKLVKRGDAWCALDL